MSDSLTRAAEVVRNAEGALRELMQRAVDAGEYDSVAVLARWAEQLSQVGVNRADPVTTSRAHRIATPRSKAEVARNSSTRRRPKRGKSKYPVFKRSGDNLVKVSWSKASKSEYYHQASKAIVLSLVEKMQDAISDDKLLTMDEVLPLVTNDHDEVPSYQSYACLAWLRAIGVVEQHGRRGYSIVSEQDAKTLIEEEWAGLTIHGS